MLVVGLCEQTRFTRRYVAFSLDDSVSAQSRRTDHYPRFTFLLFLLSHSPPHLCPPYNSIHPSTAMTPTEVTEKLGLLRMKDRSWYCHPSNALDGDGLFEGTNSIHSLIRTFASD